MYGSTLGTNATNVGWVVGQMFGLDLHLQNVTWGWFDGTFILFGFVCTNFWGDENSSLLFFFIAHVNEAMNLDDEIQ
jgi:hypothetical protein